MGNKFGRKVRELREAKKKENPTFSLRRFAEAVGISATFLSKVETGEAPPPSAEKIKKIAELLDANPDEFLALAGKVDPELSEIIRERPRAMADLLRTTRDEGLTEEDINTITEGLRKHGRDQEREG